MSKDDHDAIRKMFEAGLKEDSSMKREFVSGTELAGRYRIVSLLGRVEWVRFTGPTTSNSGNPSP